MSKTLEWAESYVKRYYELSNTAAGTMIGGDALAILMLAPAILVFFV